MTWDSMKYGGVQRMVEWLDRAETEAARERRMRRILRRLPPRERRFALALKHVLLNERGPEDLHREKS